MLHFLEYEVLITLNEEFRMGQTKYTSFSVLSTLKFLECTIARIIEGLESILIKGTNVLIYPIKYCENEKKEEHVLCTYM